MCFTKIPDAPAEVPERQAAKAPDDGNTAVRADDSKRRRLAMAASIFTSQNGSLGMPATSGAGAMKSSLGA